MMRVGRGALVVPVMVLVLSGCGSEAESIGSPSTAAPAGPTQADLEASTAPVTRPPDPTAPDEITAVSRPSEPAARIDAPEGNERTPVTYPDGVSIEITSVARTSVTEVGPGAMTGAPVLSADIVITNSGNEPLELSSVVVSARYGEPEQLAPAAYIDGSVDFSGAVAAGESATGTYSFRVPSSDTAVTLVVDPDAVREPAVFRSVR